MILQIKDLVSGYGHVEVLHSINLEIAKNETITVLGSNGAGKSTLLMTILGDPRAKAGTITYNNQIINNFKTHQIAKLGIALVPEGRRIFQDMTIEENLKIGNTTALDPKDYSYIERVFELFPVLKERAKLSAGYLSGGEQQMLAIGRALMSKPQLLLLDEPSLGLAPKAVDQIYEILTEIKNNTTIFLIEQNITHALNLASRYYIMANGNIVKQGTKDELSNYKDILKHYLGGL